MELNELVEIVFTKYQRKNQIIIPDEYMSEYRIFSSKEYEKSGNSSKSYVKRVFMRDIALKSENGVELKNRIYDLYIINELGIKSLAKKIDISYSECRTLLQLLNIPIRKGYNVVTDNLRTFRSNRLKSEYKNKTGWFTNLDRKTHKTQKGVGGYYFNKNKQKYVWLRSTWEYVYAKYLDKINVNWDVEVTQYNVNDFTYTPDFFIYDDKNELVKIVEIKGFWKDKLWKTNKLKTELKNIQLVTIENLDRYILENSSYQKELKEWKEFRKLKI
jgi:hypothetical protein